MRSHCTVPAIFVSCFCALLLLGTPDVSGKQIAVGTTAEHHNHRFEGWGTSLAWWGNEVGGQSNAQGREDLLDIFFDPDNGLGLNFARYNIGADQNPNIPQISRPGAAIEGYIPNEPASITDSSTWNYDFSRDATQRLVLDGAIERGVTQVEAFSNSAPWWLTINQSSTGNPSGANLSTDNYDEFIDYQLTVADHFESNLGIQFNSITPLNEPGSGFWRGGTNQEGLIIPQGSSQSSFIRQYGQELIDRNSVIGLVGPEETSTDQTADSLSLYGSVTRSFLSQVNTHTYPFNGGSGRADSERLFDEASEDGLRIFATEYGTGQGAVRLAEQINSDIRYLDAVGWTYWQALEDNNGSGWGLAISNFNGNNPRFDVQDQYFALKQFSSFIRPGSEIIELEDQEEITAAFDPRTGTTTLVVTNDGGDNTSAQYGFDLTDRQIDSTRLIRTTDENNSARTDAYASLGPAAVNGNNVSFDAVGNAITSVVIHHNENLIENGNFDLGGGNGITSIQGWQAEGAAAFDATNDLSGDSSGSAALLTSEFFDSGKIFQTGIGSADTDLTGVAYQLSLDVLFQNEGGAQYDADTFLALEFYGADDETLASVSLEDYETEIKPAFAVKDDGNETSVVGSDPNDSVYRTFFSGRFVAPEGTRYVRPVIRFDGVNSGSNSFVHLDNVRLQEVHPEAAAREWNSEGGGEWANNRNWLNHALVENNQHAYFGNAINEDSEITFSGSQVVSGLTFFSDYSYNISGDSLAILQIGETGSSLSPLIDVRVGDHQISTFALASSDLDLQVLDGASLLFDSIFDANGFEISKLGAGSVDFNGLFLNGGRISAYASQEATIDFGSFAILDGDFELLLAPGQELEAGDLFELASYSSLAIQFENVLLPTLGDGLAWELVYGSNALTAAVIADNFLLGDFDGDGDVDGDDVDFYIGNLGELATGEFAQLDLDNDGEITLADHDFHVSSLVTTSNGVTGALFGDVNLDGSVNVLDDAFALVGNLGLDATSRLQGDLNADGFVDVLGDAFILVGDLGESNASSFASRSFSVSASAVPEPNSFAILFAGAIAFFSQTRRRTRSR